MSGKMGRMGTHKVINVLWFFIRISVLVHLLSQKAKTEVTMYNITLQEYYYCCCSYYLYIVFVMQNFQFLQEFVRPLQLALV